MLASPLLPLNTLQSNGHSALPSEVRLARVRAEVAVVRTLADHIEVLVSPRQLDGVSEQLAEEMARLGRLLFEAAAELAESPAAGDIGGHMVPAMRAT